MQRLPLSKSKNSLVGLAEEERIVLNNLERRVKVIKADVKYSRFTD